MRFDASTSHANFVIRLKGPLQSSHNPVSPRITCTFEPYQRPKKKNHHTCKRGLCLESSCCNCRQLNLLEQYRKKLLAQLTATNPRKSMKRWFPETAGSCFNTERQRQVRPWKKAGCFTLLRRITRLKKCKFRDQVGSSLSFPEGFMPAWITHLLRTIFANSDVECILLAKTLQLYLTGVGWWKDPRRYWKVSILSKYGRLRQVYIQWSNSTWSFVSKSEFWGKFDVPVLGLAGCHSEKW